MEYRKYYLDSLYPLQDRFFEFLSQHNHGQFYLTGGTALSRFYHQHRFSEDLDFFSITELGDFRDIVTKILNDAKRSGFSLETETISDHFFRVFVKNDDVRLKIDFVNEMAFHWGDVRPFPVFDCVDNQMNILANKMTCISRYEVKDIADIWALAKGLAFSWPEVMAIADKKSPVDPVEISKIIKMMPQDELKFVRWAFDANIHDIHLDLQKIAEDILLGRTNALSKKDA